MSIVLKYVPQGDPTLYTKECMMMYEHMGQHVAAAAPICQAVKYLNHRPLPLLPLSPLVCQKPTDPLKIQSRKRSRYSRVMVALGLIRTEDSTS